eukprot:Em0001g3518a
MIPKVCSFSKFPNHPHRSRRQHCGSQLLRAVVTKDGDHKFYPLKVYCYKPLIESLQTLLSKPGVLNSCEHWRERKIPKDTLCDIYDGKIWEEFQYVNGALKSFTSTVKLVMLVLVVLMMAKMNRPYEMNLTTVNKQIWPPCKQLKLQEIV